MNCFIVYCYVRNVYVLCVSGFSYRIGGVGGLKLMLGWGEIVWCHVVFTVILWLLGIMFIL